MDDDDNDNGPNSATVSQESQSENEVSVEISERLESDTGDNDENVFLCPKCSIYGVTFSSAEDAKGHIEKQHSSVLKSLLTDQTFGLGT